MDLKRYLGKAIGLALDDLRDASDIVEYAKVERDEFVKLPELGFYLHATDGLSIVSGYRVYLEAVDDYWQASKEIRGEFGDIVTIDDLNRKLGKPIREVPSIRIPGRPQTLRGYWYAYCDVQVAAHYHADGRVSYIQVKCV